MRLSSEFGTWASSLAFRLLAGLRTAPKMTPIAPDRQQLTVSASVAKRTQTPTILPTTCQPSCPDSLNQQVAAVRGGKLGAQSHRWTLRCLTASPADLVDSQAAAHPTVC